MRYIDFHKKSLKAGHMVPNDDPIACWKTSGLCDAFGHLAKFELICPTEVNLAKLASQEKNTYCWGSDSKAEKYNEYTPLRQNLVLLMAALNDEL